MILKIQGFDLEVNFEKGSPSILIIEDGLLFSNTVSKMHYYINNNDKEIDVILLDQEHNIVKLYKHLNMYADVLNMDVNNRKILTKLYKQVVDTLNIDVENTTSINLKFNEINTLLLSAILDIDIDLVYDEEVMLEIYFKAINLRIDDEKDFLYIYDKMCFIVDIEAQLDLCTCLVFVNTFAYLDQKQISNLLDYISHKNVEVLFVERYCHENMKCKVYRIDEDFVEHDYSD
jgi:CRISPR type II-A-associated protein Csn2